LSKGDRGVPAIFGKKKKEKRRESLSDKGVKDEGEGSLEGRRERERSPEGGRRNLLEDGVQGS